MALFAGASKLSGVTVTVFREVDTAEPTPIGFADRCTLRLATSRCRSTHAASQLCSASLVCFFDIRLGSVETLETITEEVGPERDSNLRPPARDSFKHGFANVHIVHAA